ncbi:MAG: hemin uptake protein HemP [Sphingopyxis sp.]|nr:hemin uptake protein HemP [Sphingopyxis sp.]
MSADQSPNPIAGIASSIEIDEPGRRARVISSNVLFSGQTEVAILHDGCVYRLRITKQGKLILNK